MDASKIKALLILIFAALAAVYLGIASATAQFEAIAWVVGVLSVVLAFSLGAKIWVLIPLSLGFSGTINAIPGTPPVYWIATLASVAMLTLRHIMRARELRFRFTILDFAILLQAIAIGQAWLRKPAGMLVFGGDTVGGKNYFLFAFSIVAYLILASIKTNMNIFKKIVIGIIAISLFDGSLMLISQKFPSLAFKMMPIYSGVIFAADADSGSELQLDEVRLMGAKELGSSMGMTALTLYRPITLANPANFLGFSLFGCACILVLLSGFRSVIGLFAITYAVSSIVRGKKIDIIIAAMTIPILLSLLVVTDQAKKLPFGVQRVLSVLPINVEDRARLDAEKSNDFRFDMWKMALTTDRYIQNKLLGDGFGYSAESQKAAIDAAFGDARRAQGMDILMERGSFHGFHVETIRMTGILGLLFAVIGMFIFMKKAINHIKFYRNHTEWRYVLFICIPFLIHPFYYLLVFGSYRSSFPLLIVSAGMLKILENIQTESKNIDGFTLKSVNNMIR